jgi:hypothetical protein
VRGHGQLVVEVDIHSLAPLAAGNARGWQAVLEPLNTGDANAADSGAVPGAGLSAQNPCSTDIVLY